MDSKGVFTPFSRQELMPQEECLEVVRGKGRFSIGVPKETHQQEKRVCLTPDAIQVLVENGHEITVESGAGEQANFSDQDYSEAGARIEYSPEKVFAKPLVLKVAPPTLEEIQWMDMQAIVVSSLQLNLQTRSYFESLAKKKITAIAFEYLKDDQGLLPITRLLSEIAGTTSVLIAAELLSSVSGGNGILMGGISGVRPTEVVIIGGGTVGEYAARAAIGLGATVKIFDNSLSRLRRLQNDIGQRLPTSTIDPKELSKALMRCDVAIGAVRGDARTPIVVTQEMVENMKSGAIIIDVSIDNGGCFETSEITTHNKPTRYKHGVIHYGVTNITSRVSRTATKALSNFFLQYLLQVANEGGFENLVINDAGLRQGIYMYRGRLTKSNLSDWFNLPFKDINLLII